MLCFDRLLQISPDDPFVSAQYAELLSRQSDDTRAIGFYERARSGFLRMENRDANVERMLITLELSLAGLYARVGQDTAAEPLLLDVVRRGRAAAGDSTVTRMLVGACNQLGILYGRTGELRKARAAYRQALAVDRQCMPCMANLASVLAQLGAAADALVVFDAMLREAADMAAAAAVTDAAVGLSPDVVPSVAFAVVRRNEVLLSLGRAHDAVVAAEAFLESWCAHFFHLSLSVSAHALVFHVQPSFAVF